MGPPTLRRQAYRSSSLCSTNVLLPRFLLSTTQDSPRKNSRTVNWKAFGGDLLNREGHVHGLCDPLHYVPQVSGIKSLHLSESCEMQELIPPRLIGLNHLNDPPLSVHGMCQVHALLLLPTSACTCVHTRANIHEHACTHRHTHPHSPQERKTDKALGKK